MLKLYLYQKEIEHFEYWMRLGLTTMCLIDIVKFAPVGRLEWCLPTSISDLEYYTNRLDISPAKKIMAKHK
jgi:hypothetical protein